MFCVLELLRRQPQRRQSPGCPSMYRKHHSWQVEKSHGIYFHHTTSISGIHTAVQWHIQTYDWDSVTIKPEHPVPVHFCWLLFSVGTQKFPLSVVKSTLQAQWANSSTNDVYGASVVKKSRSVHFLLTCPNVAVLFHTRNSVPAVQSTVFIPWHKPLRKTVDCTTYNKQHLVSSMEHVPRGIFTSLSTPPQSRWCL